jgi:carbonic anhydrase
MDHSTSLPPYLVQRYHGWKATSYAENKIWYKRLAGDGQNPRAMIISCCDSRVHVTSIFGADQGEFFIHRNIANLVPPYAPDGDHHGTSAAVEYAVTELKVAHLIVLGHSNCGGVNSYYDMCAGNAPELTRETSFIGRWMDLLRPGKKMVDAMDLSDEKEERRQLEKAAVIVSLENLMTFPFIKEAVENEMMSIHGLWTDIGEGGLMCYQPEKQLFVQV